MATTGQQGKMDTTAPIQGVDPKNILIVRLSAIGDIVCTLPLLEELKAKFPAAKFDWVVGENHAGVLQGHPDIRTIFHYPRRTWWHGLGLKLFRHFFSLRRIKYDLVFDAQSSLKSGLNVFFVRSPHKIGFAKGHNREGSHRFFNHPVSPGGLRIHRVKKNLTLLNALGMETPEPKPAPIPVNPLAVQSVKKTLHGQRYALIHPATSGWGKDKTWFPDRFGQVAEQVHRETGLVPLLTWGPGEKDMAEEAARSSGGKARVAPATRTLQEFIAFIDQADLVVCGDTGALQIAAFLGRPCVGIFGPTDPAYYGPIGPRVAVAEPPGAPPAPERDRTQRSVRMEQVTVEMVMEKVREVLGRGS